MEVRLLGPVEVVVGDRASRVPGAGERALLALLALQAGRLVTADRLIDDLWGDDLPANPVNALQVRVSKLRKVLTSLGADGAVVVTRPPGYLLDLDPACVDALRVAADVRVAREHAARDAADAALDAYRRALGAWRGPALVEFADADWAAAEARRLEELRVAATEERLGLDLDTGRHADVLDELDALVSEHPLRERLRALHMLALYRAGRQADALAAYQAARAMLEDELGLDPSPELRELEAAILRQEEHLAAPAAAASPMVRPQLPQRVASFVGRESDVDALTRLVAGHRLVTVTGPGGIGKTTAVVETARAVEAGFADGAWFVALAGLTSPVQVPSRVADALGLPPAEPLHGESDAQRLARRIGHRRALVVLDNCEHVVDAAAQLVEALLTRCPHLVVLATSRELLAVPGEVQYALSPLEPAPAVRLFLDRASAASRAFDPDDDDLAVVAGLCERLDGMPLAIELAAARVRTLPVQQIAARLHDRFRLLSGGARTADARHQTLRATVDWSHQLLDDDERVLFRRLGVFRGSWSLEDAETVCGGEPLDAADVLDLVARLVDRSLVSPVQGSGRFRMLETIRHYAQERLHDGGEHDAVMARHLTGLRALVEASAAPMRGHDQGTWMARLQERHDDLLAALVFCREHADGHGEVGLELAAGLGWFWYLGDHEEGRRWLHELLRAVPAAAPRVRGRALQALSMVERPGACLVHPSELCATAARASIPLLAEAGDDARAALSRILLAVEGARAVDLVEGLRLLDEAAAVLPSGSWELALAAFVRMEILVRQPGGFSAGIAEGDVAVEEFARLGDRWGVSAVLSHQGFNLRVGGRHDDALAAYERSLEVAREGGLQNTVQMVAGEAGILRASRGDEDRARALLGEARDVARRYGYLSGEGIAEVGSGVLARHRGDLVAAEAHFLRAADLLAEVGSLPYLGLAHSGRGYVAELRGDLATARACHGDVLAVARALPEPTFTALALEGLAGVAVADDAWRAARLLATAASVREKGRRPVSPVEAADVARVTGAVRRAIGDEAYDALAAEAQREDTPDLEAALAAEPQPATS